MPALHVPGGGAPGKQVQKVHESRKMVIVLVHAKSEGN